MTSASRQPDYAEYTGLNLAGRSRLERILEKVMPAVRHNRGCGIMAQAMDTAILGDPGLTLGGGVDLLHAGTTPKLGSE